jgi:hypothetical protein
MKDEKRKKMLALLFMENEKACISSGKCSQKYGVIFSNHHYLL